MAIVESIPRGVAVPSKKHENSMKNIKLTKRNTRKNLKIL